jgi:hypothetical protein
MEETMTGNRIGKSVVAVGALTGLLALGATAASAGDTRLNNAKSAYNVGKSAFDVSTHVIGTAPKPNPVVMGYQLGQAGAGFAQGARQGYKYQPWTKPDVISSKEGARTLGYTAGVLGRRAVDRARGR